MPRSVPSDLLMLHDQGEAAAVLENRERGAGERVHLRLYLRLPRPSRSPGGAARRRALHISYVFISHPVVNREEVTQSRGAAGGAIVVGRETSVALFGIGSLSQPRPPHGFK